MDKEKVIILVGFYNSGKSSILEYLKGKEGEIQRDDQLAYHTEILKYEDFKIISWDSETNRGFVVNHYQIASGIIFVVDSSDFDELENVKKELLKLINEDYLSKKPISIFAHKQDINEKIGINELSIEIGFKEIQTSTNAQIIGTSIITGDGIKEGLTWFKDKI